MYFFQYLSPFTTSIFFWNQIILPILYSLSFKFRYRLFCPKQCLIRILPFSSLFNFKLPTPTLFLAYFIFTHFNLNKLTSLFSWFTIIYQKNASGTWSCKSERVAPLDHTREGSGAFAPKFGANLSARRVARRRGLTRRVHGYAPQGPRGAITTADKCS